MPPLFAAFMTSLPAPIADALALADPSWQAILLRGLEADQGRVRDKNSRETIRDTEQPEVD